MTEANPRDALALQGGKPSVVEPIPWAGYGKDAMDETEERYVLEALRSKRLNRGEWANDEESFSSRLEIALEKFLGVKHVHLLSSCTTALETSMYALGIGPGDEVIVPAVEWVTGVMAIVNAGAVPIVAQVDETFSLSPEDVARKITPRTRAILVVHMHGHPADMGALQALAKKHDLRIIEDCAISIGGKYQGKMLGSMGDTGCFSFHAVKLVAAGDGGFLATNRDDVYEYSLSFCDGTFFPKRKTGLRGRVLPVSNRRVNELTAAVALAQVERLPSLIERLRKVRTAFVQALGESRRFQVARSNDPDGDVGIQVPLLFHEQGHAPAFEKALNAEGVPMCWSVATGLLKGAKEYHFLAEAGAQRRPIIDGERAAIAPFWPAMQEKKSLSDRHNPWTHPRWVEAGGSVEYKGVQDVGPTFSVMSRLLMIRLNPQMEPRHGVALAEAVKKVDRHFGSL